MQAQAALGFFNIGGYEWVIILIIALLLFGRRLPEVMRGLGGGVREFRKGIDGSADDDEPKGGSKGEQRDDQPAIEDKPSQPIGDQAGAGAGEGEATKDRAKEG